jgi:iron(III) dicitrate-binding protein
LIVGETQRSKNYSLNCYAKNDTNKFTKQKDVVSFTNFYSCGTATETSVPCLFSDLKRENFSNREAKARENLVDIINKLGIKTYFFGNNSGGCKGVCDNLDQNHTSDHRAEGFDEVIFNEAKKGHRRCKFHYPYRATPARLTRPYLLQRLPKQI